MKKFVYILFVVILVGLGIYFVPRNKPDSFVSSIDTGNSDKSTTNISLTKLYQNDDYHFTFSLPEDAITEETPVDTGSLIIVKYPPQDFIFQVYTQDIEDEPITISESRLRQDIPDLVFRDPQDVLIGNGSKGLAFISKEVDREQREVWFTFLTQDGSTLYQITAPLESDDFLKLVLNTWQFE